MIEVRFENERDRAAAYDDGELIGECTFFRSADICTIDHTYVDNKYRGQGVAQRLVKIIVDEARVRKNKIIPLCSFAKREFDRITEYRELLQVDL